MTGKFNVDGKFKRRDGDDGETIGDLPITRGQRPQPCTDLTAIHRRLCVGRRRLAQTSIAGFVAAMKVHGDLLRASTAKRPLLEHHQEDPIAGGRHGLRHHGPSRKHTEAATQEEKTTGIDVADLLGDRHNRFVGTAKPPLSDDIIAVQRPAFAGRRRGEANFDMIGVEPIIGIEKADPVISLGDREQGSYTAGGIATVAVRSVELYVSERQVVDPGLGKPISDKQMVARDGLVAHALDAALEKPFLFLVIGCNHSVTTGHDFPFVRAERWDSTGQEVINQDLCSQITIKTLRTKNAEIARQLGCHRNTVSNIVARAELIEKQTRVKESVYAAFDTKIKVYLQKRYKKDWDEADPG